MATYCAAHHDWQTGIIVGDAGDGQHREDGEGPEETARKHSVVEVKISLRWTAGGGELGDVLRLTLVFADACE